MTAIDNYKNLFEISFDELTNLMKKERDTAVDFVWCLRNVQLLEGNRLSKFISNYPQDHPMKGPLELIKTFKHLITVPNRHSQLSSNEIYQQAFIASHVLTDDQLTEIYTAAWSNVNMPPQLNLIIVEPMQDLGFPLYALKGICNGLIGRYQAIDGISLPFKLNEELLDQFCNSMAGRQVNEICLQLAEPFSPASLEKFVNTLVQCQVKKVSLIGLPNFYHQTAKEAASEAGIELKLTQLPA